MTDLATLTTPRSPAAHRRTTVMLALGLLGGCALGALARAWMRLIAEDPAFTWSGTLFIVLGFTFFGLTQSMVALTRRRTTRWWKVTGVRAIGAVGMLPLFVAAGALMFPTVAGCGLASARTEWPKAVRGLCLVVASLPVVFVGNELVGSFGWSLHTLAGFVMMLAVYAMIIWATRFTFAAHNRDSPTSRRTKIITAIACALLLMAPLVGGGIK